MKKIQNRLLVLVNPAKALAIYEQDMKPFTEGGKSKRGKEYEPKASIRTICKYIGSSAFDKVIEALNDANLCADLFESTISPIAIQVDSVDERCEIVRYRRRGTPPDQTKELGFGRLRNILTEIKARP